MEMKPYQNLHCSTEKSSRLSIHNFALYPNAKSPSSRYAVCFKIAIREGRSISRMVYEIDYHRLLGLYMRDSVLYCTVQLL